MKTIISMMIVLSTSGWADEAMLKELEKKAKIENPSFKEFSVSEGEKLFRFERTNTQGKKVSCMDCHTKDPKQQGQTRTSKTIDPLAPVVNPERFTKMAKMEKWFKRNCKDVYERPCTEREKGDFTKYMMSIK